MQPSIANFGHPYQPYDIQLDFMTKLYDAIENRHVAIFESPTGTGKSLSLICGSLTWLRDHNRRALDELSTLSNELGDQDWLTQAENASRQRELRQNRENFEKRLASIRDEGHQPVKKKPRLAVGHVEDLEVPVDDCCVDDYTSDQESSTPNVVTKFGLSSATQALLDKYTRKSEAEDNTESISETKIIFASRTHSQLVQFVGELRRVRPPSSLTPQQGDASSNNVTEVIKHVSLGSRKNLCIHPQVSRLAAANAMNERCLELQKPGVPQKHKCEYLAATKDNSQLVIFRNRVLASIQDIEDIKSLGRATSICPYYASRSVIDSSEVVTLPYPLLLQKSSREALGLSIKDNVVIIDEAHNLPDAIAGTFAIAMTMADLEYVRSEVTLYVEKFKKRLSGRNRVYIAQLMRLLLSITTGLSKVSFPDKTTQTVITPSQLLSGLGVDQIKPHDLIRYLHISKLPFKIETYGIFRRAENEPIRKGLLMEFQSFLAVLMLPAKEGRFFVSKEPSGLSVRYILLDPTEHFRDVVEEARAVVLAGGTMSPTSDYVNYLFSYLPPSRLKTYSFDHIVPETNLLVRTIQNGSEGSEFDFTFAKKSDEGMIENLGLLLLSICTEVPDGVVVFFPSFVYLANVLRVWGSNSSNTDTVISALRRQKVVFFETKTCPVDQLLSDYAASIDGGKGGLLLSVIGGRLSEGINFSDKLGRAVVAVGLPYANKMDVEWSSKVEHITKRRYEQLMQNGVSESLAEQGAQNAAQEFYQNSCLRALNQSIGRVIRHKNDYAAIILVDKRYTGTYIRRKLPKWIQSSLKNTKPESTAALQQCLRIFFTKKKLHQD